MSAPKTTALPTVKVKSEGGYTVINEEDFDEKVHKIFKDGSDDETPEITEKTLGKLNKENLLKLAGERKLEIDEKATNKDIADAILKFEAENQRPSE